LKKFFQIIILIILISGCTLTGEEVEVGDTVGLNYIGMLEDGKVFDTTLKEVADDLTIPKSGTFTPKRAYNPFTFTVGEGGVISGFEEGVIGMKVEEQKEIVIPPEDGYGNWSEDKVKTFPRIMKVAVIETARMNEIKGETGLNQFVENQTFPWRYWEARVIRVTDDIVVLRNEVSDMTLSSDVGPLEIKVEYGTITMTISPTLDEVVTTRVGTAKVNFINETDFSLDYNHPLAGETLVFNVTVLSIEKASG
jgi:FKBP-type peptidyl-prolyl cis-trans isomerase 2